MSIRVSVSAATRASLLWKKTRLPSADAPRNWLLTAPFPPAGPVETTVVVLWLPEAVAHIASAVTNAATITAALFNSPPKSAPACVVFLLNRQSGIA